MRFADAAAGPLRIAEADVDLIAVGAGRAFSASSVAAASGEGDFGLAAPLALPADRNGEAVRETIGGVPVRDGGLLGLLMVGLSQEEKKSSAGSPAGVDVPSPGVGRTSSVMTTSSGYLDYRMSKCMGSSGCTLDILLGISCGPSLEFFFVFIGCIRGVFHLCIFTGESGAPTVGLEELCGRLIASNFHSA